MHFVVVAAAAVGFECRNPHQIESSRVGSGFALHQTEGSFVAVGFLQIARLSGSVVVVGSHRRLMAAVAYYFRRVIQQVWARQK